jgi:hypothetical protein
LSERAQLARWRDAIRDSNLDGTAKLVGFVISTWWDRNGNGAYPSKPTIAAAASLRSPRAVDEAVHRLEAAGFLDVSRSKGRSSNRYSATLPTPHDGAGSTMHADAGLPRIPVHGLTDFNPASNGTQPCTKQPLTLHPAAPESAESANAYTRAPRTKGNRQRAIARAFQEYDRVS